MRKMSFESKDTSYSYENENENRSFRKKSSNQKDGLTSNELKNRLIQVVKNKGIFDSMKVNNIRKYLVL